VGDERGRAENPLQPLLPAPTRHGANLPAGRCSEQAV